VRAGKNGVEEGGAAGEFQGESTWRLERLFGRLGGWSGESGIFYFYESTGQEGEMGLGDVKLLKGKEL
jgi:hypothetical protein